MWDSNDPMLLFRDHKLHHILTEVCFIRSLIPPTTTTPTATFPALKDTVRGLVQLQSHDYLKYQVLRIRTEVKYSHRCRGSINFGNAITSSLSFKQALRRLSLWLTDRLLSSLERAEELDVKLLLTSQSMSGSRLQSLSRP